MPDPDNTALQKMMAGHAQMEQARLLNYTELRTCLARAKAVHNRLLDDREVLARYGHQESPVFATMREDAKAAVAGLAHAVEVMRAQQASDGMLTPQQRARPDSGE